MSDTSDSSSSERSEAFHPDQLDRMVITPPLLDDVRAAGDSARFHVIIDLNLDYPAGREAARERVRDLIAEAWSAVPAPARPDDDVRSGGTDPSQPYLFAELPAFVIKKIVEWDRADVPLQQQPKTSGGIPTMRGAIYRIWEDAEVHPLITRSIATVKADAAQVAYSALGTDIVWAVLDSGVEADHVHFKTHDNLQPPPPVAHRDFSGSAGGPLVDAFGHGTHVAGIIAGGLLVDEAAPPVWAMSRIRDELGNTLTHTMELRRIAGMAPRCKIVSLKVLDDNGRGRVSMIIDAIQEIQRLNDYGRRLLVHGVNLSVGYDFDPKWFACGQSPLCVEVDRLVRSGVVVVVAAGNTGYGWSNSLQRGNVAAGLTLSINDPGNAELAITVGATHRDMPHTYGVSYFSSKGPTGDGRMKPDLVAPGERIISCAAGLKRVAIATGASAEPPPAIDYVEDSGTSMAAPHVSGIVAAFLSIRREYIARPDEMKRILLATATDLKRDRSFQGAGLVDLMRAIQSV
ncbi:MAG: S8 family peptidase [Vulcanimicrobiaceae bacterium]